MPAVDVPNNPQTAASMSALNASIFHLIADALPNVMAAIETLQKQTVVHPTTASGREDKHKYILSASSVDVLLSAVMNFRGLASAVVSASTSLRGAASSLSRSSTSSSASSSSSSNTTTATSNGIDITHQAVAELRVKSAMDVTDDQTEVTAGSSSSTRATISSYLEQLQLQRQHQQHPHQQQHAYHTSSSAVGDMNGAYFVYPYETALQVAQNRASASTQPLIRTHSAGSRNNSDGNGHNSSKSKSDKCSEDSKRNKIPGLNISDKSLEYLVHLQDHRGERDGMMAYATTSSARGDAELDGDGFDGTARSNISGVTCGLASRREEDFESSFAGNSDGLGLPSLTILLSF